MNETLLISQHALCLVSKHRHNRTDRNMEDWKQTLNELRVLLHCLLSLSVSMPACPLFVFTFFLSIDCSFVLAFSSFFYILAKGIIAYDLGKESDFSHTSFYCNSLSFYLSLLFFSLIPHPPTHTHTFKQSKTKLHLRLKKCTLGSVYFYYFFFFLLSRLPGTCIAYAWMCIEDGHTHTLQHSIKLHLPLHFCVHQFLVLSAVCAGGSNINRSNPPHHRYPGKHQALKNKTPLRCNAAHVKRLRRVEYLIFREETLETAVCPWC